MASQWPLVIKELAKLDSEHQQAVEHMSKAVKEIEREIRELSSEERTELMRSLIAEFDAPADANVESAWLETSQRRYRKLVEGKVIGVPGPLVFDRLRKRLGE
jgi:acyl-CoA reductase-like NAD-dependent aldehyde dehydrogenase